MTGFLPLAVGLTLVGVTLEHTCQGSAEASLCLKVKINKGKKMKLSLSRQIERSVAELEDRV